MNSRHNSSDFSERQQKAFDIVLDTVKLLITLCTASIGFIASIFVTEPKEGCSVNTKELIVPAIYSALFFAFCIMFCFCTILKITGLLAQDRLVPTRKLNPYDKFARIFFAMSLLMFTAGIISMAILCWGFVCGNR